MRLSGTGYYGLLLAPTALGRFQGLVPARVWGFESPLRHHGTSSPLSLPSRLGADNLTAGRGEGRPGI
jgi:hypothetical protein